MKFVHIIRNMQPRKKTFALAFLLLGTSATLFAQQSSMNNESDTYMSNPLFLVLLLVILLLLGVVLGLSSMVKSAAIYNLKVTKKNPEEKPKPDTDGRVNKISALLLIGLLVMHGTSASAQNTAAPAAAAPPVVNNGLIGGLDPVIFWSMISVILLEALVIWLLYSSGMKLLKVERNKKTEPLTQEEKQAADAQMPSFLEKMNASVAIEDEHDIMLDHNYDGIRELDNNLPPWWKYGFYFTILFAVVYLIHFHVLGTGSLQIDEYKQQMAQADADMAAYRKNAAGLVDETNVTQLHSTDSIAQGAAIFTKRCVVCHGEGAKGLIGPNLTDDYWLHGGNIKDLFKTIKYGVQGKGMKSWENELAPQEIQMVASYVKSLRGTNPPGAKAAEGDLYVEAGAVPADTTGAKKDSAAAKTDSLKPKKDSTAKK